MDNKQKTILVVDDEELLANLLSDYFKSLGYNVLTAQDAEEAAQFLNNGTRIDVVLSDINLPGMSGLDLLRIARETRNDISVIMLTGYKTLDNAIASIRHGAKDFITKPFELNMVRKTVEKVLRNQDNAQRKLQVLMHCKYLELALEFRTRELDAGLVAKYLAELLWRAGFCSEQDFNQLCLAFTETLLNAQEHGNLELPSSIKGDDFEQMMQFEMLREERMADPHFAERKISIVLNFNPQTFSLNVTDEGPGFDWRKYIDNQHKVSEINTDSHGRGFMFIRHIIDEVYFNEKGNSITLVKHASLAVPSNGKG
ncbi:MAG: response regulator [Calditrichaeota bacterium]|nr:MAG: response regulator [Calditrichota bacterium]